MATALVVPPDGFAVSREQAKTHLRVEITDDDAYIEDLIAACSQHLEQMTGLKLITQTWRQYADAMPANGCFRLEVAPVQGIAAMTVYDADGNGTVIAPQSLELDAVSHPARLLVHDMAAPGRAMNGIEIDIVAGFGDTAVDVPEGLRRALLLLVAHAYEFRGAVPVSDMPASEPQGFRTLIAPFRRMRL
jgi:uncharacterized phiE125 gp8 family phage protein